METLRAAYEMAKQNDGAPGKDGVTFEAIEAQGVEALLEQLRDELTRRTYNPLPARKHEIPKDGGKVRVLSIPAIRDRVVQGALKLILEPVFEADFQGGSFGYRPTRTAHDAIKRVAEAIVHRKTRVDARGNPDAITLAQIRTGASEEFDKWLEDRRNRKRIPHRLEAYPHKRKRPIWAALARPVIVCPQQCAAAPRLRCRYSDHLAAVPPI
jgi:retron-type reverse transcriptase